MPFHASLAIDPSVCPTLQAAFMSGKLKMAGNMGMAMKLGPLLLSAAEPRSKL